MYRKIYTIHYRYQTDHAQTRFHDVLACNTQQARLIFQKFKLHCEILKIEEKH